MTAPYNNFVYEATLVRVIDADTYDLMIDEGFRDYSTIRVRLHGVDAYELHTPEGTLAAHWVDGQMRQAGRITVQSYHDARSFERWVCDVWLDDELLADRIRDAGYAKPQATH